MGNLLIQTFRPPLVRIDICAQGGDFLSCSFYGVLAHEEVQRGIRDRRDPVERLRTPSPVLPGHGPLPPNATHVRPRKARVFIRWMGWRPSHVRRPFGADTPWFDESNLGRPERYEHPSCEQVHVSDYHLYVPRGV